LTVGTLTDSVAAFEAELEDPRTGILYGYEYVNEDNELEGNVDFIPGYLEVTYDAGIDRNFT